MFAYGMVLFELLSQSPPFDNIVIQNRNKAVKDGKRPNLDVKETHSPLLFQELMSICWEQDPDNRPRMEQVVEWIRAPEFERLRAEMLLKEVKSISCACVCRIHPEYESSVSMENADSLRKSTQPIYNINIHLEKLLKEDLEGIGNLDSLVEKYHGNYGDKSGSGGITLSSLSLETECIEESSGKKISNSDEDIYHFLPSRKTGIEHVTYQDTGQQKKSSRGKHMQNNSDPSEREVETSAMNFDPCTQIWMCGHDQRKGLLQIFTFNEGHSGYYVSPVEFYIA